MRIGAVPYLNGTPLVHGLEENPEVELIREVPSKLISMLLDREIDTGMVSSAACLVYPQLRIVPGISISCLGPAESVKFFYKGALKKVSSVALDTSSLTSTWLVRVILKEKYGLSPVFTPMPPPLSEMLAVCDGAVLIGDNTMQTPDGTCSSLDLGSEWWELTGLPFVFAVWAVNARAVQWHLSRVLRRAKLSGLESLEEISISEAERLNLPVSVCRHYLTEVMNYDLTPRHIQGLALFREKAQKLGLVREVIG